MITKEYIQNNLLTSNNSLNSNKTKFIQETPEQLFLIFNSLIEAPKCSCGKSKKFQNFKLGYRNSCGDKDCYYSKERTEKIQKNRNKQEISLKVKETWKNKYPKDETKNEDTRTKIEKIRETKLEKYGDENFNNISKCKQTKLEKYGDENFNNREKFKETLNTFSEERKSIINNKREETNIKKYGVSFITQNQEVKEKKAQTNLVRYGSISPSLNPEIKNKTRLTTWVNYYKNNKDILKFEPLNETKVLETGDLVKMKECGHIIEYKDINGPISFRCLKCFPFNSLFSLGEKEVLRFIKENYDGEIIENSRGIIGKKELDIYLPDLNLAFEFNGIYWHSSKSKDEEFLFKTKHLEKTEDCESKYINLFHIKEFDWKMYPEIIKSMILQKLGKSLKIPARKCLIKEISTEDSMKFLNQNHLQGEINSSIRLGLYYQDELVSLMTFSKPRFNKKYDWELLRFCNKKGVTIQGGASKLFKYFKDNFNGSIISYADRSHSSGNLYTKLGLTLIGKTTPNYNWVKKDIIFTRYQTQKHKLDKILKNFNPCLSESENMYNNGYYKYFDSGNLVFSYQNK